MRTNDRTGWEEWLTTSHLSLRIALPLALVLFTIVGSFLSYLNDRRFLKREIEREATRDLIADMTRLQANVSKLIQLEPFNLVQDQLGGFGDDPHGELAILVDDSETVIAAARHERIGLSLAEALPERLQGHSFLGPVTMDAVRTSMSGVETVLEGIEYIVGIYPVPLASERGEIPLSRVGFLILARNLGPMEQHALIGPKRQAWQLGIALAVFAVLTGIVLHYTVTRRILGIAENARRVASGDLGARSNVRGSDEIAALGQAFDDMVEKRFEQEQVIRENEEKLLKLNEELEERVRHRTAELEETQDQLIQAEKLSTLGQLAGGVAHELRTPMSVVVNTIHFLEMTVNEPDEDIREAFAEARRALSKSQHIITELLDYARRPQPLHIGTFPFEEAIRAALKEIEIPGNIRLETDSDNPLCARGDEGQVQRIINNLVRNAIQAMPEGGELRVRTGTASESDRVFAEVEDNGNGIGEENPDKVFEPLFSKKTTGIGLGLTLSRYYADLNDGRLEVAHSSSRGTTFRLTLPKGHASPTP